MAALKLTPAQFADIDKNIQEKIKKFQNLKTKTDEDRKNNLKNMANSVALNPEITPKKPKKKIHLEVLDSLKDCQPEVKIIKNGFVVIFPSVRLYTLNQLFAIMQYSKFNIFGYKKMCHMLVRKALFNQGITLKPPLKVSLYRSGSRKVDNDSLCAMFKYFIDGLGTDPKDGKDTKANIIIDDNPEIIQEYLLVQEKGEPCVAMRVEMIKPRKNLRELFFF